jgi:hypothetical protein
MPVNSNSSISDLLEELGRSTKLCHQLRSQLEPLLGDRECQAHAESLQWLFDVPTVEGSLMAAIEENDLAIASARKYLEGNRVPDRVSSLVLSGLKQHEGEE